MDAARKAAFCKKEPGRPEGGVLLLCDTRAVDADARRGAQKKRVVQVDALHQCVDRVKAAGKVARDVQKQVDLGGGLENVFHI